MREVCLTVNSIINGFYFESCVALHGELTNLLPKMSSPKQGLPAGTNSAQKASLKESNIISVFGQQDSCFRGKARWYCSDASTFPSNPDTGRTHFDRRSRSISRPNL